MRPIQGLIELYEGLIGDGGERGDELVDVFTAGPPVVAYIQAGRVEREG
jgi:hypothetical protein